MAPAGTARGDRGAQAESAHRISVIIPTLNEERTLPAAIDSARAPEVCEVIVVDGGSGDGTWQVAAALADVVVRAPQGRARQMNEGARLARGDVLLFLHADTRLPPGFGRAVTACLADPKVVGGRFDVRLDPATPLLRLTAFLINLRSRWTRIATGDQAQFVRREVFARLGGFPDQPLMEDVELSRALKRAGRVACLRQRVATSSRRWLRHGPLRTITLMWTLRLLYFCGVSAATLKRWYAETR